MLTSGKIILKIRYISVICISTTVLSLQPCFMNTSQNSLKKWMAQRIRRNLFDVKNPQPTMSCKTEYCIILSKKKKSNEANLTEIFIRRSFVSLSYK